MQQDKLILVRYDSVLHTEFRNIEFVTKLIDNSSNKNKEYSIGGCIEIQRPFKFIRQTLYGREEVVKNLYNNISKDSRHTIINSYITEIDELSSTEFGMTWIDRQKGVNFVISDTLEHFILPMNYKKVDSNKRRESIIGLKPKLYT